MNHPAGLSVQSYGRMRGRGFFGRADWAARTLPCDDADGRHNKAKRAGALARHGNG